MGKRYRYLSKYNFHQNKSNLPAVVTGPPPPVAPPKREYLEYEGGIYRPIDLGFMTSYVKIGTKKGVPASTYSGPKIPWELWRRFVAASEWSTREHKCEIQMRLFLNPRDSQEPWKLWMFPQEKEIGLHTKEIAGEAKDLQMAQFIGGSHTAFGTIHHHCHASAFQSGTDHNDEKNQPGIHITLGNLGANKYTIHARFVSVNEGDTAQFNADLAEWFELPPAYAALHLPVACNSILIGDHLCTPPADLEQIQIPQIWKDNLIEVVRPATHIGFHGGYGGWGDDMDGWSPGGTGYYSQPNMPLGDPKRMEAFADQLTDLTAKYMEIEDFRDLPIPLKFADEINDLLRKFNYIGPWSAMKDMERLVEDWEKEIREDAADPKQPTIASSSQKVEGDALGYQIGE